MTASDTQRQGPAWKQIADTLRDEISAEVYPPGAPLPGESQLAERYQVSRPTVRRAINTLVGEGLLTVAHGRGTFVRPRPQRQIILTDTPAPADLLDDEYSPALLGWMRVQHPRAHELRDGSGKPADVLVSTASRSDAEALGIRTGTRIVERFQHWQHRTQHHTIALTSAFPAYLIGLGTDPAIEEPAELWDHPDLGQTTSSDEEPPAGYDDHDQAQGEPEPEDSQPWYPYDVLARARGPVSFVTTVTARMPHGQETEELHMTTGSALLEVRRTMINPHGLALEVTTVLAPADRFEVASQPQWEAVHRAISGDTQAALRL